MRCFVDSRHTASTINRESLASIIVPFFFFASRCPTALGDYIGTTIGVIKGDTRSLDSSSYDHEKGP